jgi:uncharacterized protein YqeY
MLSDRMRDDLTRAMKARDRAAVAALRTTLAAFANAEAPPRDDRGPAPPPVYGRLEEHPRLILSDDDLVQIVRNEIEAREVAIAQYCQGGRQREAAALRVEVAILRGYIT